MTKYQFNQIRYNIMFWSALVIANLSTVTFVIVWFLIVAAWAFYCMHSDDTERD